MPKKRRAIDPNELSWTGLAKHNPELLRERLKDRLAKPVDVNQLAREIRNVLKSLGTRPGSVETVAHHIASRLGFRFSQVSVTLERLIANHPVELAAALEASDWHECSKVAEMISSLPKPKKIRVRQLTGEQRRKGVRSSKNRYERRKRQRLRYGEMGLIEEQFAIRQQPFSSSDPSNRPPLTNPVLECSVESASAHFLPGRSVEFRVRADVGRSVLPGIIAWDGSAQFSQVFAIRSARPTYFLQDACSHFLHSGACQKRQMASRN